MPGDNQSQPISMNPARPLPILVAALAIGLLFDFLLYGKLPGVGFALFVAAVVAGTLILSKRFGQPLTPAARWFAALAVGFAAAVAVRTSYELTFMNVILSLCLLFLVVSEAVGNRVRQFPIEKYFSLAWLPLHFLGNVGPFFSSWFQQRQGEKTGKASAITRGILLALPILVLFTLLFSSADLVFRKYAKAIINIDISLEMLVRILLVLVVTLIFLGAFWYIFAHQRKNSGAISATEKTSSVERLETRILLGSVNVLFLLFIVVQFAYLFGGQQNVTGQGLTYAEYARRGFFELIIVAVISWLVVWTLDRTLVNSDAKTQRTAKFLSLVLIVQVFVIMASAFMRLVLYEQAYGFTTLRFYSHVFIVWLTIVFVLLLYKLFVSRREDRLAFSILISVLTFAAAVNLFNPDAFIAKQNVQRYVATGKVDVFYLDQLSPDAVPGMLPLLETKDVEVVQMAANSFFWKLEQLDDLSDKWQSLNLGRRHAWKLLQPKRQELEKRVRTSIPSFDFLQSQSTAD